MRYQAEGTPLVVIAGKEYGTGSSRDWAAKGTLLLGVRAVIAESYERIHRSNLVGHGRAAAAVPARRELAVARPDRPRDLRRSAASPTLQPRQELTVEVRRARTAAPRSFQALARIDGPIELDYYRNGGILPAVLRRLYRDNA